MPIRDSKDYIFHAFLKTEFKKINKMKRSQIKNPRKNIFYPKAMLQKATSISKGEK